MNAVAPGQNIHPATVAGFGDEWDSFDQTALNQAEWNELFDRYFAIFPWDKLPADAEGFDLGCGSGRWAAGVAGRVGQLNCIDPSAKALAVCEKRLSGHPNSHFFQASVDAIPLPDASQDFGYSLGVLHHIPRKGVTSAIAAGIYWPLARGAAVLERLGRDVSNIPLAPYRHSSFYTMRTDALDRLGTRLEQRFTRRQIEQMMQAAGLEGIRLSEEAPFWVAVGYRKP